MAISTKSLKGEDEADDAKPVGAVKPAEAKVEAKPAPKPEPKKAAVATVADPHQVFKGEDLPPSAMTDEMRAYYKELGVDPRLDNRLGNQRPHDPDGKVLGSVSVGPHGLGEE